MPLEGWIPMESGGGRGGGGAHCCDQRQWMIDLGHTKRFSSRLPFFLDWPTRLKRHNTHI
jgi:hypothetical protein